MIQHEKKTKTYIFVAIATYYVPDPFFITFEMFF